MVCGTRGRKIEEETSPRRVMGVCEKGVCDGEVRGFLKGKDGVFVDCSYGCIRQEQGKQESGFQSAPTFLWPGRW